mgnify:CR=1 FL=1
MIALQYCSIQAHLFEDFKAEEYKETLEIILKNRN